MTGSLRSMRATPDDQSLHPMAEPFRHQGSNGRAVLLIHGFTGIPGHFRPLGGFLHSRGYSVIAPLLPGHGTTPEAMAQSSADDWIGAVEQARAEAASTHDEVHLVGLSMGGLIAIIVGASAGAATISTINSPITFRDKRILLTPFLHRLRPMVTWPDADPPDLDEEVAGYWVPYPLHPTRSAADLLSISRTAHAAARTVTAPTLVIQSLADQTVDPRSGRQLAEAFGGDCRLVWLQRSIHNSLLDRERDVIHASVLRRVGGDPAGRPG